MHRYDQYGERIEPDETELDEQLEHDAQCRDGWLGDDDEGRPVPCYRCRPHLKPRQHR